MDNIKVSTKTIIAVSNLNLDIQKIFTFFPIGIHENNITIQTIYYGTERRGIVAEKKRRRSRFEML